MIGVNIHSCSHFMYVKYAKTPISEKFENEFIFDFDELVGPNPLVATRNTITWTVYESGLVSVSVTYLVNTLHLVNVVVYESVFSL